MPTAFVTGGSGFIGGALIRRLRDEGWDVRALARSAGSAEAVRALGAEAVSGDLEDPRALAEGAEGCELAFHAAAKVEDWGDPDEFERLNVVGTQNVLDACRAAGVRRIGARGHRGRADGRPPLVNVNENAPLRPDSPVLYSSSKAKAELRVRAANREGLETVVVRPRFVWGRGDTTLLPALAELVQSRTLPLGGGRPAPDGNDPRGQHRGGPLAGGHPGPRRWRLLRDRRRARGLSRLRHPHARHPGRDPRRQVGSGRRRRAGRGGRRAHLAA